MKKADTVTAILSHGDFIKKNWAQKPCLFSIGEHFLKASKLPSLLDLMTVHAIEQPQFTAAIERGRKYYLNQYILDDKVKLIYCLALKRALAIANIDKNNPFYTELARKLSTTFQAPYLATSFISLNKRQGLHKHFDEYHLFVFQHMGESRWRIHHWKNPRKLVMDIILKPGCVLYVPPGFYHRVIRETEETVHISIGLRYPGPGTELRNMYQNPVFDCLFEPGQKSLSTNEMKQLLEKRFHIRAIHKKRKRKKGKLLLMNVS